MLEGANGAKASERNGVAEDANKKVVGGEYKKKQWRIRSKEGTELDFYPVFKVNEESQQVECRFLEMRFKDEHGKEKIFTFDWLNIYMFVYYTCNEELRRGLAQRYERKINYIPYDVQIKLTEEDKQMGTARRRIELPVDELNMAVARDEALRMVRGQLARGGSLDPRSFLYKGRK